jgi:hypothetical protein
MPAGEIFSFERLRALIATAPDARKAAEAAVAFGQEDDITVITLTTPRDRSDVHHFAVGARVNKFRGLEAAQCPREGSGIRFRLGVECSTIR